MEPRTHIQAQERTQAEKTFSSKPNFQCANMAGASIKTVKTHKFLGVKILINDTKGDGRK